MLFRSSRSDTFEDARAIRQPRRRSSSLPVTPGGHCGSRTTPANFSATTPAVPLITDRDGRACVLPDRRPFGSPARVQQNAPSEREIPQRTLSTEDRAAMNWRLYELPTPPVAAALRRPSQARSAAPSEMPAMLERSGEGFLPGEDVAVAIVSWHASASPDGYARLVGTVKFGAASEVILFGRTSGAISLVRAAP